MLCRPGEFYQSRSQDGFPRDLSTLSGLMLGLQARRAGSPGVGGGVPRLPRLPRVGTQTQEESTGLQALIHPHPRAPSGEGRACPQGLGTEEDGKWMRWAFTGVCTSETVQTQKDKRCDCTSARDQMSGLREGPGRALRGTEFPFHR